MQLHVNEVAFRGDSSLPDNIKQLQTPFELFTYFFDEKLFEFIAERTNMAARSVNINTTFTVSAANIGKYIGILIFMSMFKYSGLESYSGKYGLEQIKSAMPWNRFYSIKRNICFQDETLRKKKGEPGYDPLFRIRKIANELNQVLSNQILISIALVS